MFISEYGEVHLVLQHVWERTSRGKVRGCGDSKRGGCVRMMATQPWGLHLSCLWCPQHHLGQDASPPHCQGYGGRVLHGYTEGQLLTHHTPTHIHCNPCVVTTIMTHKHCGILPNPQWASLNVDNSGRTTPKKTEWNCLRSRPESPQGYTPVVPNKHMYVNCLAFVQKKCSTNPTLQPFHICKAEFELWDFAPENRMSHISSRRSF